MKKRLAYAGYVLLLFGHVILLLRGMFTLNTLDFIFGVLLGVGAYYLRCYGKKHLDFDRMYQLFPMGEAQESTTWRSRAHVERLLNEFHQTHDWVVRQGIRKELEILVKQEPCLMEMYQQELKKIHPTIFYID